MKSRYIAKTHDFWIRSILGCLILEHRHICVFTCKFQNCDFMICTFYCACIAAFRERKTEIYVYVLCVYVCLFICLIHALTCTLSGSHSFCLHEPDATQTVWIWNAHSASRTDKSVHISKHCFRDQAQADTPLVNNSTDD